MILQSHCSKIDDSSVTEMLPAVRVGRPDVPQWLLFALIALFYNKVSCSVKMLSAFLQQQRNSRLSCLN